MRLDVNRCCKDLEGLLEKLLKQVTKNTEETDLPSILWGKQGDTTF